jgi:hypothetical protein
MRIAATALALLTCAATASATLRVFVTNSSAGYGLEDPANHMVPTISTVDAAGNDYYGFDYAYYSDPGPLRPGTYPPAGAPSGTAESPVQVPPGDWVYIWLQFQNEPKAATINGLQTVILESGVVWDPNNPVLPAGVSTTYYLCNNTWEFGGPDYFKRWHEPATPPAYPEWHNNPQTMTRVDERGFYNIAGSDGWNLWDGATRIGLLGAMEAPADGRTFQILITGVTYASGPNPTVAAGYFQFLPEPGGLLALGLFGLLFRRR